MRNCPHLPAQPRWSGCVQGARPPSTFTPEAGETDLCENFMRQIPPVSD